VVRVHFFILWLHIICLYTAKKKGFRKGFRRVFWREA